MYNKLINQIAGIDNPIFVQYNIYIEISWIEI